VLFSIADTRQQGKVNWQEFLAFETTLQKPDAEFDVSSNLSLHFSSLFFEPRNQTIFAASGLGGSESEGYAD
jgi:hypothetical protein